MSFANVYEWFFHGGFLSVILYGVVALLIGLYKRDLRAVKKDAQADNDKLYQRLIDHKEEDEKSFTDLKNQSRTDTAMVLDQIKGLRDDIRTIFSQMHK